MKTKEELNALKEEVIAPNKQLTELTEDELKQVSGGMDLVYCPKCKKTVNRIHMCDPTADIV